ncbi:MAG TPA: MoxR family ATPase [Actinomycetota bacterium]|nr:MoxR family ATPase [Actinomycetota bacterium]
MDLQNTTEAIRGLVDNVERVITGKRRAVELAVVALFAEQHLLIEDVPGVGKTMLARSVAASIDGTFKRIQGTPDLLPADITGSSVYDQQSGSFHFVHGPVFANVVLFDEINRATPKTQSALLEVMEEQCVTADGQVHEVPKPFFVVATRNPIEHHGTFPLPEAELDRFGMSVVLGYPDHDAEKRVVLGQMDHHPLQGLEACLEADSLAAHRTAVRSVHLDPSVLDYLLRLVRSTREQDNVALGASPRCSVVMTRACQAHALLRGRDYVLPDDVKAIAPPALGHRLMLSTESAGGRAAVLEVIDQLVSKLRPPVGLEQTSATAPR